MRVMWRPTTLMAPRSVAQKNCLNHLLTMDTDLQDPPEVIPIDRSVEASFTNSSS